MSQCHSVYQVWTLWDHSFLSYVPDISVKNALIDLVTLTFEPQNSATSRVAYPKIISYTKFEHFGIIRFWVKLSVIKSGLV